MNNLQMDQLDRILSSEEALAPSSGFTASVMDVVREAAAEPPALPFPWGRLLIAVLSWGVCAASGSVLVLRLGQDVISPVVSELAAVAPELGYAATAILFSLAAFRVPRILAR